MPDPLYHRLFGCAELSTRTARTLGPEKSRFGVRSKPKLVYPYGWVPSLLPFRYTVASLYTPSNSTLTRFPFHSWGAINDFRYQPVPAEKKPPPEPVGLSFSGAPSMLQSCGRFTVRQDPSANWRASAPVGSPSRNRQSESASNSSLEVCACAACAGMIPSEARTAQIATTL